MIRTKSEDAVSPVIGVMLMLVVTIIIAAVVAAFASGVGADAEPAPVTVVDVIGIYDGYESEGEWAWQLNDAGYSFLDSAETKPGNAEGTIVDENSPDYTHILFVDSNGNVIAKQDTVNYITEPVSEEFRDTYFEYKQNDPETIEEDAITLSCLHGDSLDLSKVSIRITYNKPNLNDYIEQVFEIQSGTYSGSLSAGETKKLKLGQNTNDDLDKAITQPNNVDVTVFYGDYVIATEENLKVIRG